MIEAITWADGRAMLTLAADSIRETGIAVTVEFWPATRECPEHATLYAIARTVADAKSTSDRFVDLAFTLGYLSADCHIGYWRGGWHLQLRISPPVRPMSYDDEWKGPQ